MKYVVDIDSECMKCSVNMEAGSMEDALGIVKARLDDNDKWFARHMGNGKMKRFEYKVRITGGQEDARADAWEGVIWHGQGLGCF